MRHSLSLLTFLIGILFRVFPTGSYFCFSKISQRLRGAAPTLCQCWANVVDVGPALKQYWYTGLVLSKIKARRTSVLFVGAWFERGANSTPARGIAQFPNIKQHPVYCCYGYAAGKSRTGYPLYYLSNDVITFTASQI